MKTILIDPAKREINGIEVEEHTIRYAFVSTTKIGIDLNVLNVDSDVVMFYDKNGVLKFPSEYFYIDGSDGPIFGRGLLIDKSNPSELTVRDVEPRIAFGS